MNRKTMQIVIVVVCLAAAALVLAYSMGVFGGGSPTAKRGTQQGGPRIMEAPATNAE